MYSMYVASCHKDGGIYHYKTDGANTSLMQFVPLDRPMYLVIAENKLYAIMREVRERESAVVCFDIDKDGNLLNMTEPLNTKGEVGCHLAVLDEKIYVAHYLSGSLFVSPQTNLVFNKSSKLHFICEAPDGNLLLCDLGLDKIYVMNKSLEIISEADFEEGSGPRHLCFDDLGKYVYCACELSSDVVKFEYKGAKLYRVDEKSTIDGTCENNSLSAIRYSNNRLYVSNRGQDSISVFDVKGETLTLIKSIKTQGKCPRDFYIKDNLVACANLESDNLYFFDKESFEVVSSVEIQSPISVIIR